MRYVVLALFSIFGTIFQTAVFTHFTFPIPDLILLFMLAFIFAERTLTPMYFTVATSLIMDIIFAPQLGFYSLPYALCGIGAYILTKDKTAPSLGVCLLMTCLFWVAKELLMALFTALSTTYNIHFIETIVSKTMPKMAICAAVMIPVYILLRRLCTYSFMKPRNMQSPDEILNERKKLNV